MDTYWFESVRVSLNDIAISFHLFNKLLILKDVFHQFRSAETGLRLIIGAISLFPVKQIRGRADIYRLVPAHVYRAINVQSSRGKKIE
jgi:hypothetical protein